MLSLVPAAAYKHGDVLEAGVVATVAQVTGRDALVTHDGCAGEVGVAQPYDRIEGDGRATGVDMFWRHQLIDVAAGIVGHDSQIGQARVAGETCRRHGDGIRHSGYDLQGRTCMKSRRSRELVLTKTTEIVSVGVQDRDIGETACP